MMIMMMMTIECNTNLDIKIIFFSMRYVDCVSLRPVTEEGSVSIPGPFVWDFLWTN